jgi:cephalosporin hydroxylase
MSALWEHYLPYENLTTLKHPHFFPVYERHFAPWRDRTVTVLEIGVYRGGSLKLWQRYFGPRATIIGLDHMPACKEHESPGIHVFIGNQCDAKILDEIIEKHGVPDIVIDDGSHYSDHVLMTFRHLYPKMQKNSVYVVEDTYHSYQKIYEGGYHNPNSFINTSKTFIDQLHLGYSKDIVEDPDLRGTFGISFYDGIMVFEKGDRINKDWIPKTDNGHETVYHTPVAPE